MDLENGQLASRHLGLLSPKKNKGHGQDSTERQVVLFDMGRVNREEDRTVAVVHMLSQLSLTKIE